MDRLSNGDLSFTEKAAIIIGPRTKDASQLIGFATSFRELTRKLSDAYKVSDDIYTQKASEKRSGNGDINTQKEFLEYAHYDPKKAESAISSYGTNHKVRDFDAGWASLFSTVGDVQISNENILKANPTDNARGLQNVTAGLAQRAARLNALLEPGTGIPEAYATAEGQVRRAVRIVEKAAQLAYDWDAQNNGIVTVDAAINEAAKKVLGDKVRKGALIGALALAGCQATVTPTISPDVTLVTPTATATEIAPTVTPDFPAGTGTETPIISEARSVVTAEAAKNVDPSLMIGTGELDENGELKEPTYPENASDKFKAAVHLFYDGIQAKFPESTVFFNQDESGESRNWILYAFKDGKLVYSLVQYPLPDGTLGEKQYNDNPIHFAAATGEMLGEYAFLDIPGGTVGVIWDHGRPQFLADERTTSEGTNYYTQAFDYKTLDPVSPWKDIADLPEFASSEFSEKYPPEWSESYTANVGGMEIPISIGLSDWVVNRPSSPISEIHIAPDMVDKIGDYFMHMCFWRYTELMGNPDISYDQYLRMVAEGDGGAEFPTYDENRTDQKLPENSIILPGEGFSLTFVDQPLPIDSLGTTIYYGTSNGKIHFVINLTGSDIANAKVPGISPSLSMDVLFTNTINNNLSLFGAVDNKCLLQADIRQSCIKIPDDFTPWQDEGMIKLLIMFANGSSSVPSFSLVEP